MDPTKPSYSSKMPHMNNGVENGSFIEELMQRRNSLNGEKVKDSETSEVDGTTETYHVQKAQTEKIKFGTIGHQRKTKQKIVTDFATVSKGGASGNKSRTPLKQVQGLFNQGVSEKPSEERDQLDVFKQELAAFVVPANLSWVWNKESNGTSLEKDWTDLVMSHATMTKTQRNQQAALWEFVHTELSYINKLKIIKDLVIAALSNLHQHDFLLEVPPRQLFSNLPSILQAHQLFWEEVIYPMLLEVRRTGKPFDPMKLEPGCLQFNERFSVYRDYCWEEETNLEFTRKQMESNPQFFAFVQWVQNHPQCERMRLGDMQAKPHQRITKYPLLLKSVLENTQEPEVQQVLKEMLSSVNLFLESINDFMQRKDDEVALCTSAQRVEGYEVEGINEEIDKHVQEVCHFDLTCPIRGVGSGVIRKLLLEENLRFRGRKDSKLELVALLFSDVLLLTKVQKKGDRLKVVRPPLTLDRMHCFALKDGYSFVLVEVGELQCATNVIILVASTSERCSTWVSTIHQAKETLVNLREQEINRIELKAHETKRVIDAKMNDKKTEEVSPVPKDMTLMKELSTVLSKHTTVNGSTEAEQNQSVDEAGINNVGSFLRNSQRHSSHRNLGYRSGLSRAQAFKGPEVIEMTRIDQNVNQFEGEDKILETQMWKQKAQFVSKRNIFPPNNPADLIENNKTRQPKLPDELPDVDYPTNEESPVQLSPMVTVSSEMLSRPQVEKKLIRSNSDMQLATPEARKNSFTSQSGDMDASLDAWSFTEKIKSPGLRKRRPGTTNPTPTTPPLKPFLLDPKQTASVSNSSSNSDLEYNSDTKRNSLPATFGSNLQQTPKVGPKPSQNSKYLRIPTDVQNVSESQQPETTFQNIKPKFPSIRSSSSPNMISEERLVIRESPRDLHRLSQEEDSTRSGLNPNEFASPVEGVLERAKERGKDKTGTKRDANVKTSNLRLKYQTHFTSSHPSSSPTPSEGGRDMEEREVGIMRPRALTVSTRWKEQLVDGDEDVKSTIFLDGENVDWAGWCFDDEEVMNYLYPKGPGFLEGINQSLANWGHHESTEDGECSQV